MSDAEYAIDVNDEGVVIESYIARMRAWAGPIPLPWHVRRRVLNVTRPGAPPAIFVENWWSRTAYVLRLP